MSDEYSALYGLDDPVWPAVLTQRLLPYIPHVRAWWDALDGSCVQDTGIYPIDDVDAPPGLFYRVTRVAARSPIKGIQSFPFVLAAYLQITGVSGGSTKMVQRVCTNGALQVEEFTAIEIHNLPSTFNQGQLIALVPTEYFEDTTRVGKYIYFTNAEISALIRREVTDSIYKKAILRG